MHKQMTEMLKGTLEGVALAILFAQPAYGYEITAWLRKQGFSDIVEGMVYALLIRIERRGFADVERPPSEKGPPHDVDSLNNRGNRIPAQPGRQEPKSPALAVVLAIFALVIVQVTGSIWLTVTER